MLESSVRVRPCNERFVRSSDGRLTYRTPSSSVIAIASWNVLVRVPLGPLTVTVEPSIVTSTPDGTGMGCLPIRDTACRSFRFLSGLPDVGNDFAADAGSLRLLVGHD